MINRIFNKINYLKSNKQKQEKYQKAIETIKKNGFWFIDIPRTSSTSLRIELANLYGSVYGKPNMIGAENKSHESNFFSAHMTAIQMRWKLSPQIWENLFTFTLVRNPWDRMVSLYFYRQKKGDLAPEVSFEEYINQLKSPRYNKISSMHSFHGYYYGNCEYILDRKDNLIVDFVGKYEERESAIKTIAEKINCPSLGQAKTNIGKSESQHYSLFYNADTQKLVGDVFRQDIEMFDYEFEAM